MTIDNRDRIWRNRYRSYRGWDPALLRVVMVTQIEINTDRFVCHGVNGVRSLEWFRTAFGPLELVVPLHDD